MENEQTRITVMGAFRSIDVAVPALTPVGEYTARLAEMCGQSDSDAMPVAWSIGIADSEALPLDASLREAGIVDGQVLYLRDLAREPGEPPVVKDVDEIVADETQRLRHDRMHAGPAVLVFGLVWLLGAAVFLGLRTRSGSGAAVTLVVAALTLLTTSWGLRQRRRQKVVTDRLLDLISFTAVPCLAGAGVIITHGLGIAGLTGAAPAWVGGIAGANAAALMALAITPSVVFFTLEIQFVVAAIAAFLVLGLEADRVQAAALVATIAVGMLAISRRTAATVTAWGRRMPRGGLSAAEATATLVEQSGQTLAVVLAAPVAALLVCLPVLAMSGATFPIGLAGLIVIALGARSRQAAFSSELVMIGGSALTGVFAIIIAMIRAFTMTGTASAAMVIVAGLLVVGAGVLTIVFVPTAADQASRPAHRPPRRRSRSDVVAAFTAVAIMPVTLGVFGVFGHLVTVGRTLF